MDLISIKYNIKKLFKSPIIISLNDSNYKLRCKAIENINDNELLFKICQSDRHLDVKKAAFKKLSADLQAEKLYKLVKNYSNELSICIDKGQVSRQYRKGIVVFIDILGFRNAVDGINANQVYKILKNAQLFGEIPEMVEGFDPICGIIHTLDRGEDCPYTKQYVLSFSDTILRIKQFKKTTYEKYILRILYDEIGRLCNLQCSLMERGILTRGGIAFGDIYVNEDSKIYFGPAIIEAYDLENKYAKYPRIILSPTLMDDIVSRSKKSQLVDSKNKDTYQLIDDYFVSNLLLARLCKFKDKFYFPHFLYLSKIPTWPPDYGLLLSLKILSNVIKGLYEETNHDAKLKEKIKWLIEYNNKTVTSLNDNFLKKHSYQKEELIISL